MKDTDIEKYKSAWKEEKSFNEATLSDIEIKAYIMKRVKGFAGSHKAGLILDIILKIVLAASFIVLIFLFPGGTKIMGLGILSALVLFYMLWLNLSTYRKVTGQEDYSGDMHNFLKSRIEYYRTLYLKTAYVVALTNPFVFLSGMLYYFFFRYGEIRPLDITDIIVFSIFCIAGFALGAFIQIKQYNFQLKQLQECLEELEENRIGEDIVIRHKKQKRTIMIVFIIALVVGLFLLGLLLI